MSTTPRTDLGYLFDVDGVLTPTAIVHQRAWKQLFDAVLAAPFTEQDYLTYVDGKSRINGVSSTLASRGEDPTPDRVQELADRKNALFLAVLEQDGVEPYADAEAVTATLLELGAPMAVVSSSRNARSVLDHARLTERFGAWVDGEVAIAEGIPGKPDPAMFERAADLLALPTDRCVVIEDAEAGVAAGATGNFALVVGVDRHANTDSLLAAGADVVVRDLRELFDLAELADLPSVDDAIDAD